MDAIKTKLTSEEYKGIVESIHQSQPILIRYLKPYTIKVNDECQIVYRSEAKLFVINNDPSSYTITHEEFHMLAPFCPFLVHELYVWAFDELKTPIYTKVNLRSIYVDHSYIYD